MKKKNETEIIVGYRYEGRPTYLASEIQYTYTSSLKL